MSRAATSEASSLSCSLAVRLMHRCWQLVCRLATLLLSSCQFASSARIRSMPPVRPDLPGHPAPPPLTTHDRGGKHTSLQPPQKYAHAKKPMQASCAKQRCNIFTWVPLEWTRLWKVSSQQLQQCKICIPKRSKGRRSLLDEHGHKSAQAGGGCVDLTSCSLHRWVAAQGAAVGTCSCNRLVRSSQFLHILWLLLHPP